MMWYWIVGPLRWLMSDGSIDVDSVDYSPAAQMALRSLVLLLGSLLLRGFGSLA